MSNMNLHFQCSFGLQAPQELDDPWDFLIRRIRTWIKSSPRNCPPQTDDNKFMKNWFFIGGIWNGRGLGRHFIKTKRFVPQVDSFPQYWVLRYEYNEYHGRSITGRKWRTDIGISLLEKHNIQFSIILQNFMEDGFLGKEPEIPSPSTPNIVHSMLSIPGWRAFSGSEPLSPEPTSIKNGDGMEIRRRLENANRECPIVIISKEHATQSALIDPKKLAKNLAGAASVYIYESPDIIEEMEAVLPNGFICSHGSVRVYQPKIDFNNPDTSKKHRFINTAILKELGRDESMKMLINAVVRRTSKSSSVITTLEDIDDLERTVKLRALKEDYLVDKQNSTEYIKMLEEDNEKLGIKIKLLRDVEEENKSLISQIDDINDVAKETRSRFSGIEHSLKKKIDELEKREKTSTALYDFPVLPKNIREVVDKMSAVFDGRIVFTEQCRKTLDDVDSRFTNDIWKCLWYIATVLYDVIIRNKGTTNPETAYYSASGFEFAMKETKQTNKNKKLINSRSDYYNGIEFDSTPHVKVDKSTTRIYLGNINELNVLGISYIGHRDTAGTRNLRKR